MMYVNICSSCGCKEMCYLKKLMDMEGVEPYVQKCKHYIQAKEIQPLAVKQEAAARIRSASDIAGTADKIRSLMAKKEVHEATGVCSICGEPTSKTCASCGALVCGACATTDLSTGKEYCEACYDKLTPAHV